MDKEWYKSKTLWFNIASLIVAVLVSFGFGEHEPAEWVNEWAPIVIALVNLGLRLITDRPVRILPA